MSQWPPMAHWLHNWGGTGSSAADIINFSYSIKFFKSTFPKLTTSEFFGQSKVHETRWYVEEFLRSIKSTWDEMNFWKPWVVESFSWQILFLLINTRDSFANSPKLDFLPTRSIPIKHHPARKCTSSVLHSPSSPSAYYHLILLEFNSPLLASKSCDLSHD